MKRLILITVSLTIAAALVLPLFQTIVWVGQFQLEVVVDPTEINPSSVRYAECWRLEHKDWLLDVDRTDSGETFRSIGIDDDNRLIAVMPCSGRDTAFGLFDTYTEPEGIVFFYETSSSGNLDSQFVALPKGRGTRIITLAVR